MLSFIGIFAINVNFYELTRIKILFMTFEQFLDSLEKFSLSKFSREKKFYNINWSRCEDRFVQSRESYEQRDLEGVWTAKPIIGLANGEARKVQLRDSPAMTVEHGVKHLALIPSDC